jgi:hypothetical protein
VILEDKIVELKRHEYANHEVIASLHKDLDGLKSNLEKVLQEKDKVRMVDKTEDGGQQPTDCMAHGENEEEEENDISNTVKITYFCWDFILRFCHIASLQQSKICVYGRVAMETL